MSITTILFDADGVIQRTSGDFIDGITRVLGSRADEAGRFLDQVFAAERPCVTGEADFEKQVAGILASWGLSAKPAELLSAWQAIDPIDGVDSLIRHLRERDYLCCLATNQQTYRSHYMRTALGYDELFDEQFYSCEMGVRKPDSAYFELILRRLGRPPSEVLFLDDNEGNVAAAKQCDIQGLVFDQLQHADPARAMAAALAELGLSF